MTTVTGAGAVHERRGGLIVPVRDAEAQLEPSHGEYVPVWSDGIPAHVTLLYPFFQGDQLDAAGLADLIALFSEASAIQVTFDAVGRFSGEPGQTPEVIYLAPEPREWFVRLTQALSARFGLLPYGGIHPSIVPHLTVARCLDPADVPAIMASLERRLPIVKDVCEVWLMEETADGRWTRAATFPLRK